MLKLARNKWDEDVIELRDDSNLWCVFHEDMLYGEAGGLDRKTKDVEEIEVVIISREEYDRLNSE